MPLEYFCAFHSYRNKTAALTDEQFGRLMRAALLYSETGEVAELDPVTEMAFGFVRFDIDQRAKAYEEKCEKNRRNIQNRYDRIPSNTSGTHTETESETESESKKSIEGTAPRTPSPAKEKQSREKRFTPPSVDEVKTFCRERNSTVDAEAFVSHYDSVGWKVGKNPMINWKSAVISWERRDRAEGKRTVPAENDGNEVVMPF